MPLKQYDFTIGLMAENPHHKGKDIWRAGRIVEGMEGCSVPLIVEALSAFEKNRKVGVVDPARWLIHFAGLEGGNSGKNMEPWIEIRYRGEVVKSRALYRDLLRAAVEPDGTHMA